jgi:putative ABC transport system permease protein
MRGLFGLDHWREVLQSLRRNRLRTLLTACGVFWGVFMLVVMLGFGRGLENGASRNFGSWAMNTVFVWGQQTATAHAGRLPGRTITLSTDDARVVRAVDGVDLVVERNFWGGRGGGSRVSRKDRAETFSVSGETPEFLRLESLEIASGRFLNPDDVAEGRKVSVIGTRVREVMFEPGEDPIGARLQVGGVETTVIGVYSSAGMGGRADWANGRVFIPRTTYVRMMGLGTRVDGLAILVAPDRDATAAEAEIVALLKQRHAVHPDDPRAFGAFNRAREFKKVSDLFTGIAALTWGVGVLTLLAGAIGVSNIMIIAVAERTREIGIRKAVGATPLSIMAQVVTEATVLTGLAGYTGLVAGVAFIEIAAHLTGSMSSSGPSVFGRPEVDLARVLAAAAVLTLAGALAGLAPARSAVAIRPIEALAHD